MTAKKVFSIISKIITVLVLVFTVFVVLFTVLATTSVGDGEPGRKALFGYKAYIVRSDSMHEQFAAGDIIFIKQTEVDAVYDLEPGTIITFNYFDPEDISETKIVTHMIREKTIFIHENGEEEIAYITYGTTTGADDPYPALASQIIGTYSFRLPKMGYFFQFIRTPAGYVVVILIPFLFLIGLNLTHFIKLIVAYRREKQQQATEMQAAAEADRAEAQRLREEMEKLKAQLAARQSGAEPQSAPDQDGPADKEEKG